MVDHRERQRDPRRGRFRRIDDLRDPAVFFGQQLVVREQRRGVTVGADAEEDEVEDGEARRVFVGEFADEFLFVGVGEFFGVLKEGGVDGVDVVGGKGNVGEEVGLAEGVVGVRVVERDETFVGVEDLPVGTDRVQKWCMLFQRLG